MNSRSLANVVLLAAAGAATGWLVRNFLDHQKKRRHTRVKREIKEQLKTWEEEGGSLAPGAVPAVDRREPATN